MNTHIEQRFAAPTRMGALAIALLICLTTLATGISRASAETKPPPTSTRGAPGWDPKAALANGILAKLAGDGLDLVLNQIGMGDKTPQKLDEIKAQLVMIQQHLDEMEDRLAHAIAMNHYSDEVHATDHTRTQIENTFGTLTNVAKQAFVVRDAQDALKKATTDAEKQAAQHKLDDAMTIHRQRVEEFKASYKDEHIADALGDLNKKLYPYVGADDLVVAYRNVILSDADQRYLTKAHSESLRTVYTYFEDYESLAAWMTGEYNAAIKLDNTDLSKTFTSYVNDQRSKLPAMIPDGVVIDLGQHATTTKNKTLWMPVDGDYTWQSGDTKPGGVWAKIDEMNSRTKPLGLNQWGMPTQADFDNLFAHYSGGDALAYMKDLGLSTLTTRTVWNADVIIQRSSYYEDDFTKYVETPTHITYGIGPTGPIVHGIAPVLPADFGQEFRSDVQREIDASFSTAKNGMLAISSTGSVDYL